MSQDMAIGASLDFNETVVSAVGLALTLSLTYYSVRTIRLFKNNVAARAWVYISLSAIFFSLGLVMFLAGALLSESWLSAGGVVETIGALFLLLGLRKNFLFWASKDHFS